tara:strand:- start:266 stop:940 length:675 start_codon:yes stop_codon:yes gene_type:complete
LKTNDEQSTDFSSVMEAESDVFSDLVELSGLRPQSDFQHSRLTDVDFAGSNLSEFNFDYADLRGAKWDNRASDPLSLRYSMRGKGTDEVRGDDFSDLSATVLSNSLWAERFFAFRLLVDNWGENSDTADVLSKLLASSSGTYLPLCAVLYFSASYVNNGEAMALCNSMANAGRSQVNIYRLRKLRQAVKENLNYLQRLNLRPRYPNDIPEKEINSFRRELSAWL